MTLLSPCETRTLAELADRAADRIREIEQEIHKLEGERRDAIQVLRGLESATTGRDRPRNRSQRLGAEAYRVLLDAGQPLHYRLVLERLEAAGKSSHGVDPAATLLTALSRHPLVRHVGRGRSGIYEARR